LSDNPMNFIKQFLAYVDNVGIYDEYDAEANKMVMSDGVQTLVKDAISYLPEKLKPLTAAVRMRQLTDAERDRRINEAHEGIVIDLRQHFQEKMSKNGGAYGLVKDLVEAVEHEDHEKLAQIMIDAQSLIKGPESKLDV
jgi:hypothetical protein